MLLEERINEIIKILKKEEIVYTKNLAEIFNASESTIRRDLNILEKKELINRVHGGAIIKENNKSKSLDKKVFINKNSKEKIGRYAGNLLKGGESIYLDGGSTTFKMIKYLKDKNITVVTNGIMHIGELMKYNIKSYILGGLTKSSTGVVIGSQSMENLSQYSFDYAFLGVDGIDFEKGYTTSDLEEAKLKKKAMKLSTKTYILADESKFAKSNFVKISDIKEAIIITDKDIDNISMDIRKATDILEV